MFDNYKDPPQDAQSLPDGTHTATIFMAKNKVIQTKDGREFEKLVIGMETSTGAKVYKEYPDGYDWAWAAWCEDLKKIAPDLDPKEVANDADERGALLGMSVEIKTVTVKDSKGENRQRVYIQKKLSDSEGGTFTDEEEQIDLDDDVF